MLKLLSYTAFSLLLGNSLSHAHAEHDHSDMVDSSKEEKHQHSALQGQVTIKISLIKQEDVGGKNVVRIKLTKIKDNQPITLNDLKEAHTQKVHLLIIDDSLTDYHHIHPEATKEAGVYQFEWKPKIKRNYKLWANLVPVDTNEQQYVVFDLMKGEKVAEIDKTPSLQSTVDGYTFKLSFDNEKLVAGSPVMGKIIVTDRKGELVKTLEPVMAAYAHIVGFSEDLKSVVHLHPMGAEPTKETDRGGPELDFHLEPTSPGFIKLFAQVKIDGKELFAPFGINIKPKT